MFALTFIPKQAEVIVYDIDADHDYERLKIGDGVTNVNDLPFVTDGAVIVIDSALSDTSENAVQNKVINAEFVRLNALVGDSSVSEQISDAVAQKAQVQIITWEADD